MTSTLFNRVNKDNLFDLNTFTSFSLRSKKAGCWDPPKAGFRQRMKTGRAAFTGWSGEPRLDTKGLLLTLGSKRFGWKKVVKCRRRFGWERMTEFEFLNWFVVLSQCWCQVLQEYSLPSLPCCHICTAGLTFVYSGHTLLIGIKKIPMTGSRCCDNYWCMVT